MPAAPGAPAIAAGSLAAQQRTFNVFREEFNHERPREPLDQETPAACYRLSPWPMPDRPPPLEYPDRFKVRYVSANGGIPWNRRWVNVSIVCVGEYVGLEEVDDGIWNVYLGPLKLGRLHDRQMRIEDEYGSLYRHRDVLTHVPDCFVTYVPERSASITIRPTALARPLLVGRRGYFVSNGSL